MRKPTKAKAKALSAFLVMTAKTGDRAALTGLVRLQNPRMLLHAWRLLGDREGAADCVQDAWVEIIRGLKGLREAKAFLPWALRIVSRRVAREIGGRQKVRALALDMKIHAEVTGPEPDPALATQTEVHQAIMSLPVEQRACVALFYLEDMRVAEVAVALDVPVGTVKTRLMHARKKMRAFLERKN